MRRYVIVYQMGKVASTSIVATLEGIDGIEAVQCHFLGEKALSAIIPSITNADVPEYFFEHQLGQFIENAQITRRLNQAREGLNSEERLVVISLTRDPVEWARSSMVQDVDGYLPIFREICDLHSMPTGVDAQVVKNGLNVVLGDFCSILEKSGGIDAFLLGPKTKIDALHGTIFKDSIGAMRIFYMMLRPADWFEKHYEAALGVNTSNMTVGDSIWTLSRPNVDFIIVKYEEMPISLPKWLNENGICSISEFKRENISDTKPLAAEVASVFASDSGTRLRRLYELTNYCRKFGYSYFKLESK